MPKPDNQQNEFEVDDREDLADLDIFQALGFGDYKKSEPEPEPEKEVDQATLAREFDKSLKGLCQCFDTIYQKHALDDGELSSEEAALLQERTEAFLAAQDRMTAHMDWKPLPSGVRPQDLIRQQVLQDEGLLNPDEDEAFRITIMDIRNGDQQDMFTDKLLGYHDNLLQKLGDIFAGNPMITGVLHGLNKAIHATDRLLCAIAPRPLSLMPDLLASSRRPEMMNGMAGYVAMNKPLVVLRFHQLPMDTKQKLEMEGIAKASGLKRSQIPADVVEIRLEQRGNEIKASYRHKPRKLRNATKQQKYQQIPRSLSERNANSSRKSKESGKAL